MEVDGLLIPFEILYDIFINLELTHAYQLSLTNKIFYDIFTDEYLWKIYLFKIINYDDIKLMWNIDYRQTYKKYFDINKIKKIYGLNENIITIYNNNNLVLHDNQIVSIPHSVLE